MDFSQVLDKAGNVVVAYERLPIVDQRETVATISRSEEIATGVDAPTEIIEGSADIVAERSVWVVSPDGARNSPGKPVGMSTSHKWNFDGIHVEFIPATWEVSTFSASNGVTE